MTIEGLKQFVDAYGISDVETVLSSLPSWYMRNYALVETSQTGLPASLEHPRIILFGSDARFMMALGTHPNHPLRETIDLAELDPDTGAWHFNALDMGQSPPLLANDDTVCQSCHGSPARPIWGTYPQWPGVFGPEDDALTGPQAEALNNIIDTQALSDRFHNIEFRPRVHVPGGIHSLAERRYRYVNNVFGRELSTAVVQGLFLRIKSHPSYAALRDGFLLFKASCGESQNLQATPAWLDLQNAMMDAGAAEINEVEWFRVLGIDVFNEFPLNLLADEALENKPNGISDRAPRWNNGETNRLGDLVGLLVLHDLLPDAPDIRQIPGEHPRIGGFWFGGSECSGVLVLRHSDGVRSNGRSPPGVSGNLLPAKFVTRHTGLVPSH